VIGHTVDIGAVRPEVDADWTIGEVGSLACVSGPSLRISPDLFEEMVDHARAEAPNECCGMIATQNGAAVRVHRMVNAAASPLRYVIEPQEQYQVQTAIEDDGLDLGAIYHSHTRSEPLPSQTDINLAFYPDAVYVIVGLAGEEPDVRAWTIRDGAVAEAKLLVS